MDKADKDRILERHINQITINYAKSEARRLCKTIDAMSKYITKEQWIKIDKELGK